MLFIPQMVVVQKFTQQRTTSEVWCEDRSLGAVVTLGTLAEGRTEFLKGHMV